MGSCFSQEEKPQRGQISLDAVLPEVTWEVDETWAKENETYRQLAVEAGVDVDASTAFQSSMFKRASDWLDKMYPECARAGSAEDMGETPFCTPYGSCRYHTKSVVTLDDDFTGVFYAYSIIVAVPLEEGQKWPVSGAWLDGPDMQGAKEAALKMLAILKQSDTNVNTKHAVLRVFIGADMVSCKFDAANTAPSINKLNSELTKAFKASNKQISREVRTQPELRRMLRPLLFSAVMNSLTSKYPGCTIWDEGELHFNVGNDVYPHPTRLLVARRFEAMAADQEAAHFKLEFPGAGESNLKLLRNSNPEKDPGGILAVSLLVSVAESEPWPLVGAYKNSPVLLAAVNALTGLVKKWNREGKVQRCLFQVHMGADMAASKLVGEKFDAVPTALLAGVNNPAKKSSSLEEAFYITLEEQPKHELFQSESEFQAIKRVIMERAAENPGRYDAMLPMIALNAASHFLQSNFPECEITDEGEFPATLDGQIVPIPGTLLMVAKTKGKEKHNVVAALYTVYSPNGEGWAATQMKWLGTKEMKAADDMLLELLKKWYVEGKIAEDCMAQVMMGMDATIYKFVDGVKFEDYSDERMAQIKWE